MLDNWHHVRLEEEERAKRRAVERPPSAMSVDSHGDVLSSPASVNEAERLPSIDASTPAGSKDHPALGARSVSPMNTGAAGAGPLLTASAVKVKSPDLRVQMPPVPAFESPSPAPPSVSTPISAGSATIHSPFSVTSFPSPFVPPSVNGIVATPSPVKKKLSLSDYKSRMNKAAAARPSIGTTPLKPVPSADDPKSATSTDGGTATGISPTAEKPIETATPAATARATTSTVDGAL